MFKELFLNEGTNATITVKMKNGEYRTSFVQYDGYLKGVGKELLDNFYSQKDAERLVQKTGDIRQIINDKVDYYDDRNILDRTKNESKAVKNANEAYYKYLWDDGDWFVAQGNIKSFDDMQPLVSVAHK